MKKKVMVIGRTGQMARALKEIPAESGLAFETVGRPDIDLAVPQTIFGAIDRNRPSIVINAAAYTAVDSAESEPETASILNAVAPGIIAQCCRKVAIPLIHLSTDYVFDGTARRPYTVDDPVNPQNVYGSSKAAGELAVCENIREHLIVRLAWVYDETGRNFLNTILSLTRERASIDVVNDQTGPPTYAHDVAHALHGIVQKILDAPPDWGIYHLTNQGSATWYAFAVKILRHAERFGHPHSVIRPVSSVEYPVKAHRPAYSVLDTSLTMERFGVSLPSWKDALARCIQNKFARASIPRVFVP